MLNSALVKHVPLSETETFMKQNGIGLNFQGGDEETKRWDTTNQTVQISVQLWDHSPHNRLVSCRINDGTETQVSSGCPPAWCKSKSAPKATTAKKNKSRHQEKTEKFCTWSPCVCRELLLQTKMDSSTHCKLIGSIDHSRGWRRETNSEEARGSSESRTDLQCSQWTRCSVAATVIQKSRLWGFLTFSYGYYTTASSICATGLVACSRNWGSTGLRGTGGATITERETSTCASRGLCLLEWDLFLE